MAQQINVPGVGILEFPDGMADADISAAIKKNFPEIHNQNAQGNQAANPQDASFLNRFVTGLTDPIHGGAQLLAHALPEGAVNAINKTADNLGNMALVGPALKQLGIGRSMTKEQIDSDIQQRENSLQAARRAAMPNTLTSTITGEKDEPGIDWARLAGNTIPVVAQGLATSPLKALASALGKPTIATNAASKVIGGAVGSAVPGAMMPVANSDDYGLEKARQTTLAAALGAAFPMVAQAFPIAGSMFAPFSKSGQDKIVGRAMTNAAGNDASQALANLKNSQELVPGSSPTTGQAANNAGLASLERAAVATDQYATNEMAKRLVAQNEARQQVLSGMAGTPEQKKLLLDNIQKQSGNLYKEAFKESIPVTDELVKLASRPSMRRAEARAQNLSSEMSIPFSSTLEEMRPKYISLGSNTEPVGSVLTPNARRNLGAGMTEEVAPTSRIIEDKVNKGYFEVPPVDSLPVRDAHTLKMAMDALMQDRTLGISGREGAAINATRNKLLDMLPESYQEARQSHIALNKPVNQMDIANLIQERSTNKLTGQLNPAAYARALSDKTAQDAVGLKNATLNGMMDESQIAQLNAIKDDLARAKFAQDAGRGAGSDTIQKLAYANMMQATGLPNALGNTAVAGIVRRVGDAVYKNANEEMRQKLARALLDPKESARLMQNVTPNEKLQAISQVLSKISANNAGAQAYPALQYIIGGDNNRP